MMSYQPFVEATNVINEIQNDPNWVNNYVESMTHRYDSQSGKHSMTVRVLKPTYQGEDYTSGE